MRFIPFALGAVALVLAGCGESSAQARMSDDRVRELVRSYLMDNPEIIREALIELQAREQQAAREEVRMAAVSLTEELTEDPRAPAFGAEEPKVTIVEFFDYNCGYCKMAASWLENAVEQYPGEVRVVLRDYPILNASTGSSIEAARAALASREQGKFQEMHFALYGASAALTSEEIDAIAADVGVDVEKMRADMDKASYGEFIADNMALGEQIGIEGTPFFMVGDRIVPGADIEQLETFLLAELGE